jgi:hypothetical protein
MVSGIAKALAPTHMCRGVLKKIDALDDSFTCTNVPDLESMQTVVLYMSGSLSLSTNSK